MHFTPNKSFSDPIGVVNKIAYQSSNTVYEPIEDLTLEKMIKNLQTSTSQKKNLLEILEYKKEDEQVLKNYLFGLNTSNLSS